MIFPALALAAVLQRNPLLVCGVAAEAERRGVDPVVACALVQHESNFRVRARSATEDYGLMQIHAPLHGRYPDLRKHIAKGVDILRRELDREHGDYRRALSRYNTGRVTRRGLEYAGRVLAIAGRLNRAMGRGRTWYSQRCSTLLSPSDSWYSLECPAYAPRRRRARAAG
jgi:soluble lytic murein transglycosylase-like protein